MNRSRLVGLLPQTSFIIYPIKNHQRSKGLHISSRSFLLDDAGYIAPSRAVAPFVLIHPASLATLLAQNPCKISHLRLIADAPPPPHRNNPPATAAAAPSPPTHHGRPKSPKDYLTNRRFTATLRIIDRYLKGAEYISTLSAKAKTEHDVYDDECSNQVNEGRSIAGR